MYKTLSSWRGLLVVVIVLYHTPILELCEAAHMGVSLCFVMSGALLAMRHPRAECSWWQWMWPRARRIYLILWLVLALLLIMQWPMGDCVTDWTLPANALLVQAWVPVRDFCLSCNKPSWFLCALLACYACYPLLSRLMSCLSLKCKWMIAVSLLVAHCVVMGVVSVEMRDWFFFLPVTYFYSHYLATVAGHFGHPEFYGISWPITLPLILITASIFHCLTKKIQKR